jgi:Caspase domain
MKRRSVFLFVSLGIVFCNRTHAQAPVQVTGPAASQKFALLIGIDTYKHSNTEMKVPASAPRTGRYEPDLVYRDLKGPKYDVEAMKALLTSEKFGFPNDAQHIHILLDQQATRDAILGAMEKYLVSDAHAGDTVVLYMSSHGSVRADPNGHGQLYDLDGTGRHPTYLENTIVPYDWYLGVDDIFSRDIRHIFNQAAEHNVHVTAIFDSCHSGSLARGVESSALVARDFDFDPRPMPPDPYPAETAGTAPESRENNPVLVLSAAQKDQSAIDLQNGNPPHGLFTQELIETLQALPVGRSAADVFRRLEIAMERAPGATNQQPELDTTSARKKEPLFGGKAGSGPSTAVVSVDRTGIYVDTGAVADIGPGSEFTQLNAADGVRAVLQVTEPAGIARSKVMVISPSGAQVQSGDIVQLTKWVPAERPTLSFYAGFSNLALTEIEDALNVVQASGVKIARDPATDPWTHHLQWDGTHWSILAHLTKTPAGQVRTAKPVELGKKLTQADLRKLPAGSVVWFDAPLPAESSRGLLPTPANGAPLSAAVLTSDRNQAMYVLGGTSATDGIAYAWFKRSDLDAGVQTPGDIGAGCSPNSPYPLRTDWNPAVNAEVALTGAATQLAKLNGWLSLESTSVSGQTYYPYHLALRRASNKEEVVNGGATYAGPYEIDLVADSTDAAESRWVYVLGIDCQGKGSLVWPYEGAPPGKFPSDIGKLDRIVLPGMPFSVDTPYGTDTYLLLTTSTPLTDLSALEFSGVVTRGRARSSQQLDPLEDLLDTTSSGTRAATRPTPTNWSVQAIRTQSRKDSGAVPAPVKQ